LSDIVRVIKPMRKRWDK